MQKRTAERWKLAPRERHARRLICVREMLGTLQANEYHNPFDLGNS